MRNRRGRKIFDFQRGSYTFNAGCSPLSFMFFRIEDIWIWYVVLLGKRWQGAFKEWEVDWRAIGVFAALVGSIMWVFASLDGGCRVRGGELVQTMRGYQCAQLVRK